MQTLLVYHQVQPILVLHGLMISQLNWFLLTHLDISTLANKLTEIEKNIVGFVNKVSADTNSKYNAFKVGFDNNKFNQTINNIQLCDACVDRWRGLRENHILMIMMVIEYINWK